MIEGTAGRAPTFGKVTSFRFNILYSRWLKKQQITVVELGSGGVAGRGQEKNYAGKILGAQSALIVIK
jgi:hypothetical protein